MNAALPLADLVLAGLIRPLDESEPAFLFKHALVQDAAYEALLKQERRRLHHAVAVSLERAYPRHLDELAARLAEHYRLAEDWAPAATFALRAGTHALQLSALREAKSHYEHALGALAQNAHAPPEQRIDALLGWAQSAFRITPYEEQLSRLGKAETLARAADDRARLAQVLYQIGRVHVASGHNLRAAPMLAECFTLAAELGDERLTVIPTFFMGSVLIDKDPRRAIELFDRAIALARKHHQPDTVAAALGMKGMALARRGEKTLAEETTHAALESLAKVRSPMTESDVLLFAAWTYLGMGDVARGLEYGQQGVDKAIDSENVDCVCYGFACLGFGNLQAGRLAEAQADFAEAIRRSRFSGAELVENLSASGLALVEFMGGRAEALAALESTYHAAQKLDDQYGAATVALALGEIFTESGDWERAGEYLDAALDYFRRTELRPDLVRAEQARRRLDEMQTRASASVRA
jgi:tetratricopeptide (TPR) repeat protein